MNVYNVQFFRLINFRKNNQLEAYFVRKDLGFNLNNISKGK